jgi:hypothetical protein
MLQAGQDDYNSGRGVGDCEAMLARVPQPARSRVIFHAYPDAFHGWDRVATGLVSYQDAASHGFRGGVVRTARNETVAADGVGRVEGVGDVVEEEGEAAAAEPEELGEASQQRRDVGLIGMPQIEAGAHPPDEVDAAPATIGDQAGDPLRLAARIRLAPGGAVVGIVLGAEEIDGEAEAGHPVEERVALGV